MGSVFSPYYAWAGRARPEDHVAINVALYRPRGGRWAMTERRAEDLVRTQDTLSVGPSAVTWDGDALTCRIDEIASPKPLPMRGRIRVLPEAVTETRVRLDPAGHHTWWPIAPKSRVEVDFVAPRLSWTGTAYLDTNWGARPLEADFVDWTWARAPLSTGAALQYDVIRRGADPLQVALRFDEAGRAEAFDPPPFVDLPTSLWRIDRRIRSEEPATVRRTLEDTPFYARSVVDVRLCGEPTEAVHESLDLTRFSTRWVKALLPFRMPRRFY